MSQWRSKEAWRVAWRFAWQMALAGTIVVVVLGLEMWLLMMLDK